MSFVAGDGVARELRAQWQMATNLIPVTDRDAVSMAGTSMGLDLDSDEKSREGTVLIDSFPSPSLPVTSDEPDLPDIGQFGNQALGVLEGVESGKWPERESRALFDGGD